MNSEPFYAAMNIYHEARGEPVKGQIAVGTVTMNRANWDVKEICPVVYAPKQFSGRLCTNIPIAIRRSMTKAGSARAGPADCRG